MSKNIFCDECGKILKIRNAGGLKLGICECGFVKEIHHGVTSSEKITRKEKIGEGVAVEDKEKGFTNVCKKCGYNKCDVYDLGASYSDESDIYLFKCKKCGHVVRQAEGSGNK